MDGVFQGFATIGVVIGVGYLLAQLRIVDVSAQVVLTRLAYTVASPALMIVVLRDAPVAGVFSKNLIASVSGIAVSALTYLLVSRFCWRRAARGDVVVGVLSSVWVNAANLGIPIATYVLGDAALIAPMLLLQMAVVQPVGAALLARDDPGARTSVVRAILTPFTNPIAVGALVGLALSITGATVPAAVAEPLQLVAGMAVPAMLLAYGVSLRLGPRPGAREARGQVATITALKLVVQPAVAYAVARYGLQLEGSALLAVAVIGALPTAHNVFVLANRFNVGVVVARDAIFFTTLAAVPAVLAIAALAG